MFKDVKVLESYSVQNLPQITAAKIKSKLHDPCSRLVARALTWRLLEGEVSSQRFIAWSARQTC